MLTACEDVGVGVVDGITEGFGAPLDEAVGLGFALAVFPGAPGFPGAGALGVVLFPPPHATSSAVTAAAIAATCRLRLQNKR